MGSKFQLKSVLETKKLVDFKARQRDDASIFDALRRSNAEISNFLVSLRVGGLGQSSSLLVAHKAQGIGFAPRASNIALIRSTKMILIGILNP
jgi:hypothetical protein